jgi:hypothetical protein
MTERIAAAIIQIVTENPSDRETVWHLSPLARCIDHYPSLAGKLISALELHMRMLPNEVTDVNDQSQFDGMLEQLTREVNFCCGVIAARLDDIIDTWLDRPESLTGNCAAGSYFNALVARILAMAYSGRFGPDQQPLLLERIRIWIGRWRCSKSEAQRRLAFALVDQAEVVLADRGMRHAEVRLRSGSEDAEVGAAAVDDQALAGDVAGVGGDQEGDHAGDVLGQADPAERVLGVQVVQGPAVDRADQALAHVRGDQAGGDHVDADAVRPFLPG